jgi:ribonuclease P protein component
MTTRTGQGLPKTARIRRRGEFLTFGRKAERARTEHLVVLARASAGGTSRLGVTVSRKIGGATVRNRLKRRLREVFRRHPDRPRWQHDVVIIAKEGAGSLPFADVQQQFTAALASLPARRRA